ncbi:MAG: response regulator [Desulfobacterota bacterium]|nr:response regulator [Thermodesulfobacteriota bacterium]
MILRIIPIMDLIPPNDPKILIVDDNLQNVELLEGYLSIAGYRILKAFDGEEALKMVESEDPHLILLDVMMPKLDGYQVCTILKKNEKTQFTPVVMITALKEIEDKIRGIEAGADDFLSKPFNKLELLTRVKSLLRMRYLRDELERKQREEKERVKEIFKIYLSDKIANLVLSDPERFLKLGGEKRLVTVIFADLRGFTNFAESHPAEKVVTVLNQFFERMTQIIFDYQGTLDKFIGDAVMAYFGAPMSYPDDCLRAVKAAVGMQSAFIDLKASWEQMEVQNLGLGIGLSTGEVIFGNVGTQKIMNYTIVGDTVNIAQRLEEEALAGQILLSESTYHWVKEQVHAKKMPKKALKGRKEALIFYLLKEVREYYPQD